MMTMKLRVAVALTALLLAGASHPAENSPEAGQAIYKRANCVGCHKWHGDGGGATAVRLCRYARLNSTSSRLWKPYDVVVREPGCLLLPRLLSLGRAATLQPDQQGP